MSPASRARAREADEMCAMASDLARAAAVEVAGQAAVGGHAGIQAEGDRVVSHLFDCLQPGYAGWRWAVTVARASRSRLVTVSEVVLLPGPGALLAPEWVPWRDRLRPGDLGVGDLLPAPPDDERLVPVVAGEGDDGLAWPQDDESGPAGRPAVAQGRVLSAIGRDETAERWYCGAHGPRTALARSAPAQCVSCGFLVRLSGPLGAVFGVCANAYAPEDGRVVSVDHGCGAHSEAAAGSQGAEPALPPIIDEMGYDLVDQPGVSVEETVFESLDHG